MKETLKEEISLNQEIAAAIVEALPVQVLLRFMEGREGMDVKDAVELIGIMLSEEIHHHVDDDRTWDFLDSFPPFRDEPDDTRSEHFLHIAMAAYKQGYLHGWQDRGNSILFEEHKEKSPAGE